MSAPDYHNYTTVSGSTLEYATSPIGNYNKAETWSGGETAGTWDAFLISGSAGIDVTSTVTVADGVAIKIQNFTDRKLFEIGVTNISGSATPGAEVYLFKKGRRI